ncbi:hypothetical protein ALIPUT_00927 [Alistipes putredinis DSM 17216]|uniref:Uncharacterized protein n=1 Tax=Alistipes putredinis DSM 17216 TaxID=445970 RepID=B0MUY5_9BACT|nr:hypothetical protein ALIPUT_00927 [Alistipes putredinis DSM 17216]
MIEIKSFFRSEPDLFPEGKVRLRFLWRTEGARRKAYCTEVVWRKVRTFGISRLRRSGTAACDGRFPRSKVAEDGCFSYI